jgi:hypothetical protein
MGNGVESAQNMPYYLNIWGIRSNPAVTMSLGSNQLGNELDEVSVDGQYGIGNYDKGNAVCKYLNDNAITYGVTIGVTMCRN